MSRHMGIVRVSKRLIEELIFRGACIVENVAVDHKDFDRDTVSFLVAGNEALPMLENGNTPQEVLCQITNEKTKVEFFKISKAG